ncbi:MAG: hypothetical protein J4203_05670 [Candidatus Diapherotrites archaeon]|uniref:Uncharacterized protein n=1 Tax=Candidatus Iainarchaeum sp. TaxID=3101447 RepID=A0A8T4LBK2_9ARCH|nr:hypothetical protein [Candidatus Diapherotrites archaeon]
MKPKIVYVQEKPAYAITSSCVDMNSIWLQTFTRLRVTSLPFQPIAKKKK